MIEDGEVVCSVCNYDTTEAPPTDGNDSLPVVTGDVGGSGGRRSGTGGNTANAVLMAEARTSLQGRWGIAILGFLLYVVIINAIQLVPYLGSVAIIIVGGPFTLGITLFSISLARDAADIKVEQIFDGFKRFGVALAAYLLMVLFIFLWTLLLIVPGIIAAYAYAMTMYIVADDESIDALQALRQSKEMMRGYKWKLFCLTLRFVGWALLCILTLGIGFLWLWPYIGTSMVKFYDDLAAPA
jgi:uncharacterized membrane protein